jgi:hypothetical protein
VSLIVLTAWQFLPHARARKRTGDSRSRSTRSAKSPLVEALRRARPAGVLPIPTGRVGAAACAARTAASSPGGSASKQAARRLSSLAGYSLQKLPVTRNKWKYGRRLVWRKPLSYNENIPGVANPWPRREAQDQPSRVSPRRWPGRLGDTESCNPRGFP